MAHEIKKDKNGYYKEINGIKRYQPKGTYIENTKNGPQLKWLDTKTFARWDGERTEKQVLRANEDASVVPEEVIEAIRGAKTVSEKLEIAENYFLNNATTKTELFKFYQTMLPYEKAKKMSTENINQNVNEIRVVFKDSQEDMKILENDFSRKLLGSEFDKNEDS